MKPEGVCIEVSGIVLDIITDIVEDRHLIYTKQDRYQDAIELLRKVVELEPRNTFAQHALGMVYIQTGEKTSAMQQYYLLRNLDSNLATDLLARIPK